MKILSLFALIASVLVDSSSEIWLRLNLSWDISTDFPAFRNWSPVPTCKIHGPSTWLHCTSQPLPFSPDPALPKLQPFTQAATLSLLSLLKFSSACMMQQRKGTAPFCFMILDQIAKMRIPGQERGENLWASVKQTWCMPAVGSWASSLDAWTFNFRSKIFMQLPSVDEWLPNTEYCNIIGPQLFRAFPCLIWQHGWFDSDVTLWLVWLLLWSVFPLSLHKASCAFHI